VKHPGLIFILAALSMIGALSIDAYLPALPSIALQFGVTLAAAQQTLTVYLCAFAFMTLFYGTLSDSFGRKPVIVASLILYLLSSLGAAWAPSLGWLFFYRTVQGLSAGAGGVIGRAIVGDLLVGAEAQRAMAYISMIFGLAPAFAPILGGWLQAAFGWRSIFIFIAVFAALLLLACMGFLPESLPASQRHPFHFRHIVGRYWQVASHARFAFQALGNGFTFSGLLLYVAGAPAFVMNILHLSVKDFGWLFIPLIGGLTCGSFISGRISHGFPRLHQIRAGYMVMILASILNVAYTGLFTAALPWAVIPLFFYGLGMSIASTPMNVMSLEMFPVVRGLTSSLVQFSFLIIFTIGSGIICPLVFNSAFYLALASFGGLACSIFFWWLGTRPVLVPSTCAISTSTAYSDEPVLSCPHL
jgi:DHA1 family bicyclomycin/chloramphenicol resistance-like MFS transporter